MASRGADKVSSSSAFFIQWKLISLDERQLAYLPTSARRPTIGDTCTARQSSSWKYILQPMAKLNLRCKPLFVFVSVHSIMIFRHDFTGDAERGILKISDQHVEDVKQMKTIFGSYTKYVAAFDTNPEVQSAPKANEKSFDRESVNYIKEDADGFPVLVAEEDLPTKLPEMKALIRNFLRMHYCQWSDAIVRHCY